MRINGISEASPDVNVPDDTQVLAALSPERTDAFGRRSE
jgi:hypothetical protein